MSDQWYYSRDGQEDGPFPYAVLQQMAKVGDLLATDKIREATAQEWRIAADFPDLFVTVEPHSVSSDCSSLKGLTMALGIEPAKPGHDPLLGCDIGGVTIVRLIAEGGMGRVYEGKQEKPSRTVAVKFMRPGLTSPSVLKRFEYEAEVLGRLQHPGIAHIYSVGVHRMGNASVPYFIMEYIADARTLTKYANDLKLPTRQRLDLFRSVCDAVAHGHQKGVIHRDLKPSNILVDGYGQPKVIDFGVARATDSDMALTTMQTDVGQLIGTLQYMSPEQFKAEPNDIDVRSDVYALGVILYELLTGEMPYDVKKKAIQEVARIVQEDDPTPLSRFNQALKGDVAVIAGKCLEKERGRRYSSASELGSDVGRYLSGEAISASAPSFMDGLARLAQKHRTAAMASVGMLAMLVWAVVAVSFFAWRAEKQRDVAVRERTRANENESAARVQAGVAEEQHKVAMQAEERAFAEARNAKEQLYVANLYRVAGLTSENSVTFARRLLDEVAGLLPAARQPLEIACLRSRLDASLLQCSTQSKPVHSVAFASDGSKALVASRDNKVRVFDAVEGREIMVLEGHAADITALALSSDGARCATASSDKTVRIWDMFSGKKDAVLPGHDELVTALAFNPDGSRLATVSLDKTAKVWDCKVVNCIATCRGHAGGIVDVAFMPDGIRLVTASLDKSARTWDAASGEPIAVMRGHVGRLRALAVSRDGTQVAAVASLHENGSTDEFVRVWDASSGKQLVAIHTHHAQGVFDVAFTYDAMHVVTAGGDNLTKIWRVKDGVCVATLKGHTQPVKTITLSRDGKRLATASEDSTARVWDTTTWDEMIVLRGHEDAVTSLAFNHDGTRLLTGSLDQTARIWNTDAGAEPTVLRGHVGWIFAIAFSPDGKRLATGSWDKQVRLWDATSATELAVLSGHTKPVSDLAFSPNGSELVTASEDETIRLWQSTSGQGSVVIKSRNGPLESLAFSPNGDRLATVAKENVARVWGVGKWNEVLVLRGHSRPLKAVAFSPDGTRIATASMDNTARLWDAHDGSERLVLNGHCDGLHDIVFSHDGRRVATSSKDRTVRVWNVQTGEETARLDHAKEYPIGAVFTPDGRRVVTGSYDNKVRIWDAEQGVELVTLTGHTRQVSSIAINPAGDSFATGSGDLTARLWGMTNAEIHATRCALTHSR